MVNSLIGAVLGAALLRATDSRAFFTFLAAVKLHKHKIVTPMTILSFQTPIALTPPLSLETTDLISPSPPSDTISALSSYETTDSTLTFNGSLHPGSRLPSPSFVLLHLTTQYPDNASLQARLG